LKVDANYGEVLLRRFQKSGFRVRFSLVFTSSHGLSGAWSNCGNALFFGDFLGYFLDITFDLN